MTLYIKNGIIVNTNLGVNGKMVFFMGINKVIEAAILQ